VLDLLIASAGAVFVTMIRQPGQALAVAGTWPWTLA
jgi:hypothetical protein